MTLTADAQTLKTGAIRPPARAHAATRAAAPCYFAPRAAAPRDFTSTSRALGVFASRARSVLASRVRSVVAALLLLCAAALGCLARENRPAAPAADARGAQGSAGPLAPAPLAPAPYDTGAAGRDALVVEGEGAGDVFGMGRSVVVRGSANGVMAFGGDVIVEGRVEGDVAAVGGSVVQREGSWIGGDVWVFGGTYHHGKSAPGRNPNSSTVMYAGYEEELRQIARDPASLLAPAWTARSLGLRVLSVLFWFVVSLALTAATPGAIGRAAARLQLTSLRVAVIGLVGAVVLAFGVPVALHVLPPALGAFVGALALLLLVVAYLFGRVAINAATGRWLQRLLLREENRSESVALLMGAAFWGLVLSLPYLWAMAVAGLVVTSLGLALTARYRLGRRPAPPRREPI